MRLSSRIAGVFLVVVTAFTLSACDEEETRDEKPKSNRETVDEMDAKYK